MNGGMGGAAPRVLESGLTVSGRARVPGSKSASHRCLNLALLAGREIMVENPLVAEDTALFRAALEALGWRISETNDGWRLMPGASPAAASIHCGNAGTMFRFLIASLATLPGTWTLDGTPRLRERPAGPLITALRALGAEIECLVADGHAPLRIAGGSLAGGSVRLDAGESSQYLSALLMAGLRAPRGIEVETTALTSEPYVDLTLRAIEAFGARVERAGGGWRVLPCASLGTPRAVVEGDWSAACYPAAAATLAGEIELVGLRRDSAQGDRGFLDLLAAMGAAVQWDGDRVRIARRALTALDADLSAIPDQVPTLAALAPFARGTTEIRNVAHLRIKESDRLRAMAEGLSALGVPVEERRDGLSIRGVWADAAPPATPVRIDPHGDHRIAMSFALVGLRRSGISIAEPEVVGKSFPGFWNELARWTGALGPAAAG